MQGSSPAVQWPCWAMALCVPVRVARSLHTNIQRQFCTSSVQSVNSWLKIGFFMQPEPNLDASDGDNVDEDDNLFEPRRRDSGAGADANNPDALDAPDSSRVAIDDSSLTKWSQPGQSEQLRNRFVTGELSEPLIA